MNLKNYENRHEKLMEMLDYLSFEFSDCYSLLVREILKREKKYNNPNCITEWINTSSKKSIINLHEALLLVRPYNVTVKERHIENVTRMLNQTIERDVNIKEALKICDVISHSEHLADVNK